MSAVQSLAVAVYLTTWQRAAAAAARRDDGQSTAEYALVLLAAAAIALVVAAWAKQTNVIGRLLDVVFGGLTSRASSGR